ncbi:hypothetical protein P9112_007919 [Eukaryota sp. TZLM1-RC]
MRLRELLKHELPAEELSQVRNSFDIIGSICIVELPPPLSAYYTLICSKILNKNRKVKTILNKHQSKHYGALRQLNLTYLHGEETFETVHTEDGIRLLLNVSQCYFSVRSLTERRRIASLLKSPEAVLVMFSGIGGFLAHLYKTGLLFKGVGIELNPDSVRCSLETLKLNNITNASIVEGDVESYITQSRVKEILPVFDRIVAPIPHTCYCLDNVPESFEFNDFIDSILKFAKKKTIIHLYFFGTRKAVDIYINNKLTQKVQQFGFNLKILNIIKCGNIAPKIHRFCLDFELN